MTKIEFYGKTFDCCEHMAEIKEASSTSLLNRFYNKKQMFKELLGKVYRKYDGEKPEQYNITTEDGEYGRYCGQIIVTGRLDQYVEIYRIEDLDMSYDYSLEDIEDRIIWNQAFFVKDDNGQIYLFFVDED